MAWTRVSPTLDRASCGLPPRMSSTGICKSCWAEVVSMIVCAVDLAGSDAVVCMLNLGRGQFSLPECMARKPTLRTNHTREELIQFPAKFAALISEHEVGWVAI